MSNQFTAGWTEGELQLLRECVELGLKNSEIAKKLNRSSKSVAVKKSKIGLRNNAEHERFNNKEWLYQKYVVEVYSTIDIGIMAGVHFGTIAKWLRKHGIKARGFHERTERQNEKAINHLKKRIMENNPAWKGGKTYTNEGYIYVRVKNHPNSNANPSVLEHRLVMEKSLGRFLKTSEVVHHINEVKDDNRVENLFVFATGRDHKHFHEQLKKNPNFPMLYKYEYLHKEIDL